MSENQLDDLEPANISSARILGRWFRKVKKRYAGWWLITKAFPLVFVNGPRGSLDKRTGQSGMLSDFIGCGPVSQANY